MDLVWGTHFSVHLGSLLDVFSACSPPWWRGRPQRPGGSMIFRNERPWMQDLKFRCPYLTHNHIFYSTTTTFLNIRSSPTACFLPFFSQLLCELSADEQFGGLLKKTRMIKHFSLDFCLLSIFDPSEKGSPRKIRMALWPMPGPTSISMQLEVHCLQQINVGAHILDSWASNIFLVQRTPCLGFHSRQRRDY